MRHRVALQQEAARGGYRLIDAATLAKLYQTDRDKILLIDTRQEWEHRAGHIAGSEKFPWSPPGGRAGGAKEIWPRSWDRPGIKRLYSTERAWHESAATRRLG